MFRLLVAVAAMLSPCLDAQQQPPPSAPAQSAPAQSTPAQSTPAAPGPLPLTQIAARGEELGRGLREVSQKMPSDPDLAAFDHELSRQEEEVQASLKEASATLEGGATTMQLRGQARKCRALSSPEARQRKVLAAWGNSCERTLDYLNQQQALWEATRLASQSLLATEAVRNGVGQALASIQAIRTLADRRLRMVLDLQARVSNKTTAIGDAIEKLTAASQDYEKRLFSPDAPPIWKAWGREHPTESRAALWSRALADCYSGARDFIRSQEALVLSALLLLAVAFALARWLKKASSQAEPGDPVATQAATLAGRPISLGVLLWSPVVFTTVTVAPMVVGLVLLQAFLVPLVRILPPLMGGRRRLVYFVAAFCALDSLFWLLDLETPGAGRELTVGLLACTLGGLAWREHMLRSRRAADSSCLIQRELLLTRGSMAVLAAVLLCNALGFVLLSNFLRVCVIINSYLGVVIYTLARATSIMAVTAIRSPGMRALATIRTYEAPLRRWTPRVINAAGVAWWIYIVLDVLAIQTEVFQAIAALLNTRIGIRAFSIALGDILAFAAVLAAGFPAAKAIRFLLREEVFARLRLSRGVPDMLSNVVYYVALLMVFLLSISAAGVQLDRLTVLTGAVGVGVGFGLQTFVNNFVSGLVLQFERPIRVGDVLEVGGLGGEVSRIGIRSSTVRTFQGAEVIIPNSALISNQVVNWTLTEPLRRVEMQVPVAYGTDPEQVIGILRSVASRNPEVLRDPEPNAYFQAFGTSSLDFVLMFWAHQQNHFRLRSEIGVAVNTALRDAMIEIPLPQQDIRIRAAEPAALPPAADPAARQVPDPASRPRRHAGVG